MRCASVLGTTLVATSALLALPAQAQQFFLVTPEEIGIGPPPARYTWIPFRCSEGFADNFYHGAWYAGQPTALYRGRAYRPYYRYSAYARACGPISARSDQHAIYSGRRSAVIASEAKQSTLPHEEEWIASSLRSSQ